MKSRHGSPGLPSASLFRRFDILASVGSTNEYLKAYRSEGVPRMAAALEQTAGKGRFGRSWYSPRGQGLHVSYLLYPRWEAARSRFLTRISALAVVEAVRALSTELDLMVKRPNDVLIAGRKVCGILTEMSTQGDRIVWAVVGIGINVLQERFPDPLKERATSLLREGVRVEDPLQLCPSLTEELETYCRRLDRGEWQQVEQEYDRLSGGAEGS